MGPLTRSQALEYPHELLIRPLFPPTPTGASPGFSKLSLNGPQPAASTDTDDGWSETEDGDIEDGDIEDGDVFHINSSGMFFMFPVPCSYLLSVCICRCSI